MKKLKQRPAHEITCIVIVIICILYIIFQGGRSVVQNYFTQIY